MITGRSGYEQHSSTWGKLRVAGLDTVDDDVVRDGHRHYRDWACAAQPNTVFTVWASRGDKRGADEQAFWICEADEAAPVLRLEGGHRNGGCFIEGPFRILAHGDGRVRSVRLLDWWLKWAPMHGGQTAEVARLLGAQIGLRGRKWPVQEG